ncbi:DNA damage-regulated autophagy modulator protein 2-like isoform X2 [Ostrea edulis]|uniref:DNA damage-regulated autophagy modulator protein 2-like isoform X2 n=1 Tax=Ostrea edulis TaxID=37623 RepID=UPI0024AF5303|nr:DNA damage-regulated autophagy modulator protein 2-like isoform X2 [Ostrea edulis]XP_055997261.1 DNA damage-regulated autophagy modulator protein 2-like isoform X2 [Ostrea edulis]XP_055997262.1 DNA damage-regulated autophagy modulator protein 2-like isoform X2 [Ostrea edulis]XP_055997263.1 DNA damage-regulated autophagy modulator protein 2-like isoform X2 [Ostrea edulis]XP_055997264.1 DNA damage-regulated autophagy modulator protein 2-like isoform X2 [Ostrea edulis]
MLTIYHLLRTCLWTIPLFTVLWSVSAFAITYGISQALNHTSNVFPYISKTGTEIPERGIFSLAIFICSLSMALNSEIRFQYVRLMMTQMSLTPAEKSRWITANKLSLALGIVASFGLVFVASFQVNTLPVPHYMGAFATFGLGFICCWIHSAITYKLYKEERKAELKHTFILQILVSVTITVSFITFIISFASYRYQKNKGYGTKENELRDIFQSASISEWVLAISTISFVLTFIPGFRKIEFDGFNVKFKQLVTNSKTSACRRLCSCCS